MIRFPAFICLSLTALAVASCSAPQTGDSTAARASVPAQNGADGAYSGELAITDHGRFAEPWAAAFVPGTQTMVITLKAGELAGFDTTNGQRFAISGAPTVDYGGQGGLGDIAFLPSETATSLGTRTIYLTWVEAGDGDTRGAVLGRGKLVCSSAASCSVRDLNVIWRQTPKVSGRGHYSHRIAFSPDERYIFLSSGERQKQDPAQNTSNNLGTIVRLNLDGTPAAGNPLPSRAGARSDIWSYGHRNILGMSFDAQGRLWELEHGPAGGDELNLVEEGGNYGWPVRSNGDNYDGTNIPDHTADDGFKKPAISWTPVIAPGNFFFYSGDRFPGWNGDAIIAGLKTEALIRVEMNGTSAREADRIDMGSRIRQVVEGPDGAIWVFEDGENARLRKLLPAS